MHRAILPLIWIALSVSAVLIPISASADDVMIFTANQEFLSRIYMLDMEGNIIDYHQYDFYRFCGMEVVDGELYIAEAFAPRVLKVDPVTGDLEVFIDDWSLYYFYDVAFDGTYFYVDEWDLNRYDINGDYAGTASFDEYVLGCAWDVQYFWTLDDMNEVKCWDLSSWPTVTPVPDNNFTPPNPLCRGLFFDGEYFWSAESGETPGLIYKFDYSGKIIDQWAEPAFSGWGAALIKDPGTGVSQGNFPGTSTLGSLGNYPNPFYSNTTISFTLPSAGVVELSIYDVMGRKLRTILSTSMGAGVHKIPWSADGLASGLYWAQLKTGELIATHKLMLVK